MNKLLFSFFTNYSYGSVPSRPNAAFTFEPEDVAKLLASDVAEWDSFEYPVSLDVDHAVVGAHGDDDNGSASGSAYVFLHYATTWPSTPNFESTLATPTATKSDKGRFRC